YDALDREADEVFGATLEALVRGRASGCVRLFHRLNGMGLLVVPLACVGPLLFLVRRSAVGGLPCTLPPLLPMMLIGSTPPALPPVWTSCAGGCGRWPRSRARSERSAKAGLWLGRPKAASVRPSPATPARG